jgi:hypothetical protein
VRPFLVAALVFCTSFARAQDSSAVFTDGFQSKRGFGAQKIIATSAIGGMLVTSLLWSYDSWWRDANGKLHFLNQS